MGIDHEDTELVEGAAETAIVLEAVADAVDAARLDQTGLTKLCLESLSCWCPQAWVPALVEALQRLRETGPPPNVGAVEGVATEPGKDDISPGAASDTTGLAAVSDPAKDEAEKDEPTLDAPQFTTLDRLLIRAVVSALNDVHRALDEDELDDLVQEVLELNDARAQSFFHRGFVDSLLDRPLQPMGPGQNNERRAWYLAGYVQGVMRRGGPRAGVELLRDLPSSDDEILLGSSERPVEAGAFLLPSIMGPLLDQGEYDLALRWLERHMYRSDPEVMKRLIRWARMAFLDTDPAIVARILEACRSRIDRDPRTRLDSKPDLAHRLERRLAI
ncbi:MAG: hypothetical protein R6V85_10215, partial [Polyangia bacterium]